MKKHFFPILLFIILLNSTYASNVCIIKGNVKYVFETVGRSIEKVDYISCIGISENKETAIYKVVQSCKTKYYKDVTKGIIAALDNGELKVICDNEFNQRPAENFVFTSNQLENIKNSYSDFIVKKSCLVEHTDAPLIVAVRSSSSGPDKFINHEALILESSEKIQVIIHQNSENYKEFKALKKDKMEVVSEDKFKKKMFKNSYDPENTIRYYYSEIDGLLRKNKFAYEINEKAHVIRYTYDHDNGLAGRIGDTDWYNNSYTFTNCH